MENLLPALWSSQTAISTGKGLVLDEEEKYQVTGTAYGRYHTSIPTNPNVYEETPTFTDATLTKVAGKLLPDQPLELTELHVNEAGIPIFKLKNGQFVIADKNSIYEDTVQSITDVKQERWLAPNYVLYDTIPINSSKKIAAKLPAPKKIIEWKRFRSF